MCLKVDKEKTDELKQSIEECVTRYKVVQLHTPTKVTSIYVGYDWREGENVANLDGIICEDLLRKQVDSGEVYGGIHVFISEEVASSVAKYFNTGHTLIGLPQSLHFKVTSTLEINIHVVMPVKCYIKDLIAVGVCPFDISEVYTKVYVEKLPCA